MNEFIEMYPITKLNPADYNPREIESNAFEVLKKSLKKFGVVKPLILNGNNTLTAGHQRTKASTEIGITHVPVIRIKKEIALHDEIRFNLFHNSVETNQSKITIENSNNLNFGYNKVSVDKIIINEQSNVTVINEICKLLTKYGGFASCVIDEEGTNIQNSEYVCACKLLNIDILVYKMKNELVNEYLDICNNNEFGSYDFKKLDIKTYNQTLCQMYRLPEIGKEKKSKLYEKYIIKQITKKQRVLDFGSGKSEYAKALKNKNYEMFWYEPHFKQGNERKFDINAIVTMIKTLENDIQKNGLFDVVILDSVLNSLTSAEFEHFVILTCNSLLNENGVFYCATRDIKELKAQQTRAKATNFSKRRIEFLDKNNFSASYRNGVWTLQKFHSLESLECLLKNYFSTFEVKQDGDALISICKNPINKPIKEYEKALNIEFNMEYPNSFKHNQHKKLVKNIIKKLNTRGGANSGEKKRSTED